MLQSDVAAKKTDFTYEPENSDPSHTVGAYQQKLIYHFMYMNEAFY